MPKSHRTCEHCGTSYSKKEHYERHVRTHTREKPFNCMQDECSSKFSRRDALNRHVRICHPNEDVDASTSTPNVPESQRVLPSPEQSDCFGGLTEVPELLHDSHENVPVHSPNSPSTNLANDVGWQWQWDDGLSLDATFSVDDLFTFDPSMLDLGTTWMPPLRAPSGELQSLDVPLPPVQASSAPPPNDPPQLQASPQWFTRIVRSTLTQHPRLSAVSSRDRTPVATAEGEPAEVSRDALASSLILTQPVLNTALPCTQFLNRCIHTFTTRLWPVIPVVHLPAFKPARTHPLLLLSICSLGALADGSDQALYYAGRLFDGVQKAILVAFSPDRALDMNTIAALQAAVIGQTFALLSGRPEHLMTVQAFHGTLFVTTRECYNSLLRSQRPHGPAYSSLQAKDWSDWVTLQTVTRLLNAVYIHNGEIAAIMQQPAFTRTQPLTIPVAAPDNLFLAKTADEWANLQHTHAAHTLPSRSTFSSCAMLECFIGEISHARCSPFHLLSDQDINEFQTALCTWFQSSVDSFRTDRVQRLTMLSLWHSCFLLLLCDINLVERACARDESSIPTTELQQLRDWMLTPRAKQCISHAVLLCRLTDDMRLCDVPAAHVARSLWHAGLVLAAYSSLAPAQPPRSLHESSESYESIEALHQANFLSETDLDFLKDGPTPSKCSSLAFSIPTTLRHLGPWPVAMSYARTLSQVLVFFEA
jgi:hypothetical protein